ncbi:MAG: metallophosphoesterase [Polyangiaceae bacterium]
MRRPALLFAALLLAQCKRRAPEPTVDLAPSAARSTPSGQTAIAPPPAVTATPIASIAALALADGATSAASSAGSTAIAPDAKSTETVRFAVIGDFGAATPGEAAVAKMVKSWQPDFVITLGDNNYPAGEATTIDVNIGQFYAEFIGDYRGKFGPGSAQNRFFPSPGNHDWISGLQAYVSYFTLPGNERYYDVDRGLVHLYALDSDAHEPDGIAADSRQAAWLKERLATSKACYDVVYFHHPAYSTSEHGSAMQLRWPFKQWGAEVVMAGHDHTYERLDVDGLPYFVNGLGGASKYDFPVNPLPETRFRYNEEFGAMRVVATPREITYEFFTIDGKKRDTFAAPCTKK